MVSPRPIIVLTIETNLDLDSHPLFPSAGANPLTWNTELEQYALTYAKKCLWKHSGGPYGENLAASFGSEPVSTGVNGWNAERSDYNPASPMYSHWTQVVGLKVGMLRTSSALLIGVELCDRQVWKATSQVGCAVVKCPAGTIQPGWVSLSYRASIQGCTADLSRDPAGNRQHRLRISISWQLRRTVRYQCRNQGCLS